MMLVVIVVYGRRGIQTKLGHPGRELLQHPGLLLGNGDGQIDGIGHDFRLVGIVF